MSTIYTECIKGRARAEVITTTYTIYLMDLSEHDARNVLERKVLMVADINERLMYISTANIVSIRILD